MTCKITLGIFVKNARKELGLSLRELAEMLAFDWYELSRVENEHVDVRDRGYDLIMPVLSKIFGVDIEYLEMLRQQSEVKPLSLEKGIFKLRFRP